MKAGIRKWKKVWEFICKIRRNPRLLQAVLCLVAGVLLFFAAEMADSSGGSVENGLLLRNPCGKGEAVYEFYVDGLDQEEDTTVIISVPEQKMTAEEFSSQLPEIVQTLCERILGENVSLDEVRSDLNLVREVPEFGVTVSWESERPDIVSSQGAVYPSEAGLLAKSEEEAGTLVYLQAALRHGDMEEIVEIPVTVYPSVGTLEERFFAMMEELVTSDPEQVEIVLPREFEGMSLSYRVTGRSHNLGLIFLGVIAAVCLLLKEKSDLETERKQREKSLMEDYPDLVSEILILTGAGYPAKAAWKKLTSDFQKSAKKGVHPLYEEMQVAVNQMETGMPETRVYADFGRRCQLRCYVKFASLLESSVSTGGRQLRKLLEGEVEEAFKQRTDMAKRRGEELSSKLLLPMFGMLGVVMVMVVAPAFLSFM